MGQPISGSNAHIHSPQCFALPNRPAFEHPSLTHALLMKEFLISSLNLFGLAYWIEIVTETPQCTYYFGPFLTEQEALEA